jgi:magnesium transporter
MLRNPLLIPDLREMLQGGEADGLREFFADYSPPRIAEVLEDLEPEEGDAIFGLLESRARAGVMGYLDPSIQVRIAETIPAADATELLRLMPHDDRADLVNRLDEDRAEELLRGLAHAEREDIRRLSSYEPGTAGAVMTTDYVALPPHLTVREAIDQLRREAPDRETIDTSYVVDARRKLVGAVSLKRLILAKPSVRVEDVMEPDPISSRVDEDQEGVAHKIQQYDLLSIPVVDADDMLVGIVTHDDAMDILRQEQTEDILKFVGVSPDPEADNAPYWQGRIFAVVRRRAPWLMMLLLAENFTYPVLRYFNWVEVQFPSLGWFLPLLIGTGGNAGSQTVGTIIRGMALGEIENRDAFRVLFREWLTGFFLGLLLGTIGVFYSHLWRSQPWPIALVIGFTILGICTWANTIGALVPLVARRLGADPAVISAPFISTLVDATGLVIYYSIAILILIRWAGH